MSYMSNMAHVDPATGNIIEIPMDQAGSYVVQDTSGMIGTTNLQNAMMSSKSMKSDIVTQGYKTTIGRGGYTMGASDQRWAAARGRTMTRKPLGALGHAQQHAMDVNNPAGLHASSGVLSLGSRYTPSSASVFGAGQLSGGPGGSASNASNLVTSTGAVVVGPGSDPNNPSAATMRLAAAISGGGAGGSRGRPRGRRPLRGQFPVVPIDMVRQLGIEQQVILQPPAPVAVRNKAVLCRPLSMGRKTQVNIIQSDFSSQTTSTGTMTDLDDEMMASASQSKKPSILTRDTASNAVISRPEYVDASTQSVDFDVGIEKKPAERVEEEEATRKESAKSSPSPKTTLIPIPIPVPIYVPTPVCLYAQPAPFALPFPLPCPIFLPVSLGNPVSGIPELVDDDDEEEETLAVVDEIEEASVEEVDQVDVDEEEEETLAVVDDMDIEEASVEEVDQVVEQSPEAQFTQLVEEEPVLITEPTSSSPTREVDDEEQPLVVQEEEEETCEQVAVEESSPSHSQTDVTPVADPVYPEPPSYEEAQVQPNASSEGEAGRNLKRTHSSSTTTTPTADSSSSSSAVSAVSSKRQRQAAIVVNDSAYHLKFSYGTNAWRHWVQAQLRQPHPIGVLSDWPSTDLLELDADRLNTALSAFVREVRKPNNETYVADSIFYLCLGIQEYLNENNHPVNIFDSILFPDFTQALNSILANFQPRISSEGLLICRIEEEHLWEAQQLGDHSPEILLFSLLYFNTKSLGLRTGTAHGVLSLEMFKVVGSAEDDGTEFSVGCHLPNHLLLGSSSSSHTSSSSNSSGDKTGSVFIEFEANIEMPQRCPARLFINYRQRVPPQLLVSNTKCSFYLTPVAHRDRLDVAGGTGSTLPCDFSTEPCKPMELQVMLNRIKMVKEIQEAFMNTQPELGSSGF